MLFRSDQSITKEMVLPEELGVAMAEFELELEGELTAAYTTKYLSQLYAAIGENTSSAEFVGKGELLHFQVAHDVYGPLILGCTQFMAEYFSQVGIQGNIYYALRDATPLLKASAIVMPKYGFNPIGVYINRPLCGIGDEINPEVVPNGDMTSMIKKYLDQKGALSQSKVAWVDSGCWGTVPLVLKTHHFSNQRYYPVFYYSHNPKIPDYLHWLADGTKATEEELNCMNDSLECMFPSPIRRPLLLVENGSHVDPKLKPASALSQKWGLAALEGIEAYIKGNLNGISYQEQEEALGVFLDKIKLAKNGEWSGVLWNSTPIWSQGAGFLSKYPNNLFGE